MRVINNTYYLYKKLSFLRTPKNISYTGPWGVFVGMCTGTHTGKNSQRTQKRKKPELASVRASLMRNSCSEKIDSAVIDAVTSEASLVSYRRGKAGGWSA